MGFSEESAALPHRETTKVAKKPSDENTRLSGALRQNLLRRKQRVLEHTIPAAEN